MLVLKHSEPPLSITLLPAFRHSTVASTVTLGLLSYIIPITPIGVEIFFILIPEGLSFESKILFIGSPKLIISCKLDRISLILFSFKDNRSIFASSKLFLIALFKSFLFASRIKSCLDLI